jgi:hypothetical protein
MPSCAFLSYTAARISSGASVAVMGGDNEGF